MLNNLINIKKNILKNSFLVLDFSKASQKILFQMKTQILELLKKKKKNIRCLEETHIYFNNNEFINLHYEATRLFWSKNLFYRLFKNEIKNLSILFGPDLDIQSYPHIRVARPMIQSDNLGFHRDIDYGASIYEYSLWVPLTRIKKGAGMKFLPESIKKGYKGYKLIEEKTNFKKNSKQNISGLLYQSRNVHLSSLEKKKLIEPSINNNQFLIIPQIAVHGSELNESKFTRWSFDTRICNRQYNDDKTSLSRKRNKVLKDRGIYPYYRPLNYSITSKLVENFLKNS